MICHDREQVVKLVIVAVVARGDLFRVGALHEARASIIVGRVAADSLHLDRRILHILIVKPGQVASLILLLSLLLVVLSQRRHLIALGARALRGRLVTASEGVHAADQPDFRLLQLSKFIISSS